MPFGDLMQLERREVNVDLGRLYTEIGVRSFGKGLFVKPAIEGVDLGNKRVFWIEPDDLVISNVFAWEGAVGVAGGQHQGMIGSHRFMTWVPRQSQRVSTQYLAQFFSSDAGLRLLRKASPGSAGRNRTLAIKNLEKIEVPVPKPHVQHRIVKHLKVVDDLPREGRSALALNATQAVVGDFLDSLPQVLLSDHAAVAPRNTEPASDEVVFVPMAALNARTGTITDGQPVDRRTLATGYRRFESGDLIFARITPSMQNGKAAIYRDSMGRTGYGSSEFHVLRPRDPDHAEWIWLVLRSWWFRSRAMRAFKGTAGQQRVPADFLRSVRIPWPDPHELSAAVTKVARLEETQRELDDLRARRDELSGALLPAARNEIFTSMR